jgi:hypothetical protein
MAGQTTGLQKTYIMEDNAIGPYTAVTRGAVDGSCAIPIADNAIPLGVVTNDERQTVAPSAGGIQVGRNIAVQLSGIADVKLSGNVTYGEKVIVAAGGSVKRMPQNPGVAEVTTLKITDPCTTAGDVTLKLNGVDQKVTVALTDSTAALVATAIATAIDALDDYAAVAVDDTVTITAVAKGYQVPPTFDGGATGVTGNIAVATAGKQEGNGSFNVLGIAEASGLDGDIIPVRIDISHYYVA